MENGYGGTRIAAGWRDKANRVTAVRIAVFDPEHKERDGLFEDLHLRVSRSLCCGKRAKLKNQQRPRAEGVS